MNRSRFDGEDVVKRRSGTGFRQIAVMASMKAAGHDYGQKPGMSFALEESFPLKSLTLRLRRWADHGTACAG